ESRNLVEGSKSDFCSFSPGILDISHRILFVARVAIENNEGYCLTEQDVISRAAKLESVLK
ncbi:hypothetical protein SK128_006245, partial [Halocaridina rubra]